MLLLAQKYPNKKNWGTECLGRGFMKHPHFDYDAPAAMVVAPKGALQKFGLDSNSMSLSQRCATHTFICPNELTRQSLQTLNYAFHLVPSETTLDDKPVELGYFRTIQRLNLHGASTTDIKRYDVFMANIQTELDASDGNYIALDSTKRDEFGVPRVVLNIEQTPMFRKTLKHALWALRLTLLKQAQYSLILSTSQKSFLAEPTQWAPLEWVPTYQTDL